MKIFPSKKLTIEFKNSAERISEILKINTKESKYLTSQFTEKNFVGTVENNKFQIISSKIGIGAITVFKREITNGCINITTFLNKPFKILFSIILLFPVIAIIVLLFTKGFRETVSILPMLLVHLIFTKFFFINIAFKRSSDLMIKKLVSITKA